MSGVGCGHAFIITDWFRFPSTNFVFRSRALPLPTPHQRGHHIVAVSHVSYHSRFVSLQVLLGVVPGCNGVQLVVAEPLP